MPKNFGPAVSGYLVPTGRSFETVVYQSGKPILDRENNLLQDIDGGAAQEGLRRVMPSGWLSDDFLNSSNPVAAIFNEIAVSNTLEIPNGLQAHVNGWLLNVQQTNTTGANRLSLGAGPVGAGANRTDLVVLEVWRRLISASPSTVGKSATARIWQEGNVATDPANDLTLNYADDILDVNLGAESTKRVQIQYRLRAIQSVDLFGYPYGLDDPSVVAYSVPTNAATPNGTVTIFTYANQSSAGDPGLWIAGDGNPANTLGTVDGYMYAIPLLGAFRRNTTAWDRATNQNGGVASPGPSDRPDGLFADIFVATDVVDLRHGVSPVGWSLSEILERNTNLLLDNSLRTEITDTFPDGGGVRGTTVVIANEFGADTAAGPLVGTFDAVRRRFSDRSILETVVVEVLPPGGTWTANETFSIDPTALNVYPYGAYNWASFAPTDVRFLDVLEARWIPYALTPGERDIDAMPYVQSIVNLGAGPIVPLDFTLAPALPGGGFVSTQSMFVTLLVGYPTGVGLSSTPIEDYGVDSFVLDNPASMPIIAPIAFDTLDTGLDYPHREAKIEYVTSVVGLPVGGRTDANGDLHLPERALSVSAPGAGTLDLSGRVITGLTPLTDYSPVNYVAQRPMPVNGVNLSVYYRTAAVQAARNALLSGSLTVVPKITSQGMYSLTVGSGSQDEAYPFPTAYVQTGGIFPSNSATYSGESELSARSDVSVADFDADTGFLRLPVYVPMVANPESLTFTRGLGDVDVEGRTYFPTVSGGYIPNAYAQDLSNPDRHKDILPILAELSADGPLGHKGQMVLVLLLRYALFDETNGVYFDADQNVNTTTASVFRVKGNLLSKRMS